jgi:hypothetical protein
MMAIGRSALIPIFDNVPVLTALNSNDQDMGFDALSNVTSRVPTPVTKRLKKAC